MTDFHLQGQPHRLDQGNGLSKGEVILRESSKIRQKHVSAGRWRVYYALMIPWYFIILASIVSGLILPLLFYGFRVTPSSDPITYWSGAILCFGISVLVYKFRQPREGASRVMTLLTDFVISFVVLCVIAAVYFLILLLLQKLIGGSVSDR